MNGRTERIKSTLPVGSCDKLISHLEDTTDDTPPAEGTRQALKYRDLKSCSTGLARGAGNGNKVRKNSVIQSSLSSPPLGTRQWHRRLRYTPYRVSSQHLRKRSPAPKVGNLCSGHITNSQPVFHPC